MEKQHTESAARRRILDTAADLFYRNGIRATGIDTIIGAAGVARMTLYNHFPTKDALVEAVLHEVAAGKEEAWLAVASNEAMPPRERILALFDLVGRTLLGDDFRGCPMVNAVVESPDRSSAVYGTATAYKAALAAAMDRCVRALDVANHGELTEQLMLLLEGASVRAQLGHAPEAIPAARRAAALLIEASRTASGC
jgi:AcrR family transcriptional regulator